MSQRSPGLRQAGVVRVQRPRAVRLWRELESEPGFRGTCTPSFRDLAEATPILAPISVPRCGGRTGTFLVTPPSLRTRLPPFVGHPPSPSDLREWAGVPWGRGVTCSFLVQLPDDMPMVSGLPCAPSCDS